MLNIFLYVNELASCLTWTQVDESGSWVRPNQSQVQSAVLEEVGVYRERRVHAKYECYDSAEVLLLICRQPCERLRNNASCELFSYLISAYKSRRGLTKSRKMLGLPLNIWMRIILACRRDLSVSDIMLHVNFLTTLHLHIIVDVGLP